jgi:hypothetical protein
MSNHKKFLFDFPNLKRTTVKYQVFFLIFTFFLIFDMRTFSILKLFVANRLLNLQKTTVKHQVFFKISTQALFNLKYPWQTDA